MMTSGDPMQAAALGPTIREYPLNAHKAALVRVASVALAVLGALALGVAGLQVARGAWLRAVVLAIPGALCAALGARTLLALLQRTGRSVALVRDGLVLLNGGQVETVPWSQVISVQQDAYPGDRGAASPTRLRACTVQTQDGEAHRLDAFTEGLEQLSDVVHQETARRLQGTFWASLARGESLRFGQVLVGPEGICIDDRQLAWGSYSGITMAAERVSIRALGQDQPWATLRVADLPNPLLFVRLVRAIAADEAPRE